MKINKDRIKSELKNFDWKEQWSALQEDSPKIAGGIKLLLFLLIGILVLRGCNSCNTEPKQTEQVTQYQNTTQVKEETAKPEVQEEFVQPAQLQDRTDYTFSFTQDSRVTKEQLDYLMNLDQLFGYTSLEIRQAYFEAQDLWFRKHMLVQEDGQFVNLKKYLSNE